MIGINDKMLWALSPEAERAVFELIAVGLDRDLAVAVLERLWPESDIYNLPVEDEEYESVKR